MFKRFLYLAILLLSTILIHAQQHVRLNAVEFQDQISKSGTQLLDVRTSQEFSNGTINNALHADWLKRKEFETRVKHLDKTKPLYIFCASGGRSKEAARWLADKGFNVLELGGGTNEWRKEGKPLTEKEQAKQFTLEEYTSLISKKGNVLVDFGAPWCPPCRKMEPEIKKLNPQEIELIKIDPSIHLDISKLLDVNTIPTFIYYKNGIEIARSEGLTTAKEIESRYR